MLIYAKQPVYYVIKNHPKKVQTLYLAKDIDKKEYARLKKMGFELKRIPLHAADKMCKTSSHQGYLAEVDEFEFYDFKTMLGFDFLLILSNLSDVGNIGAIVRSAYALGVDGIVVCGVGQLPMSAIVRVSTGAVFDIPFVIRKNIYDVMNDLKTSGFKLYGADMGGKDVRGVSFDKKKALILGSEGEGLQKRVIDKLDEVVSIKMSHEFDSLNVSVAGAILIDRMRDE